uniref:DNA-directed RNA polymerase n=1 Tax=Caenorhabditis tropicalis TaxID=1561998 RepID=A0A1I7V3Z0_9PELO
MDVLDKHGITTTLRPFHNKLVIGNNEIDLMGPRKKVFETTNAVMEMINAEDISLNPGEEYLLKIANGTDIEADHAVLLKSKPEGQLLFEKTIFHPLDSRETTIRVRNTSNGVITLREGDMIGQGTIVRLSDIEKPGAPEIPPEANWEGRILETSPIQFMEKIDWSGAELNTKTKQRLIEIFKKHKQAFFNEDGDIGLFRGGIEHTINIRQDLPFPKARNYRVPVGNQSEVSKQVEEMLKLDLIEPSTSAFTSPIVLVKKKESNVPC